MCPLNSRQPLKPVGKLLVAFSTIVFLTPAMGESEIEEIIVTAQKRAESVQEVPISVTALTSEMITNRGIVNVQNLVASAPGLTGYEAPSTRGNFGVSIRGVGSGNSNNVSIDPANAIYMDGVYLGKATGFGVDMIDLERIEILRGPQGTLYGRNSTGGAINFITRKPTGELGLDLRLSGGNYGSKEYSLRFDSPKSGNFAFSFSAHGRERDDLYDNTNPDSPGFENIDRTGYRLSAVWEPSDQFKAEYVFDNSQINDENTQALSVVGMNPMGAGVQFAEGYPTNVTINSADRLGAIMQTQQFLPFLGPAFYTPQVQQLDQWLTDYIDWFNNGLSQFDRSSGIRQDYGSADSTHTSSNKVNGHSLTLAWNRENFGGFGDVEFKSITGYREVKNRNESDLDGQDNTLRMGPGGLSSGLVSDLTLLTLGGLFFGQIPGGIPAGTQFQVGMALVDSMNARGRAETFNTFITVDYEQFTQELQMVGSTDQLDYAFGLFYLKDEGKRGGQSIALFPISSSTANAYENGTTAKSAFFEGTWRPSAESRFSITAGLRYTKEEKDITYQYRASTNPFGFFGPVFGVPPFVTYVPNADWESQPEVPGIYGRQFNKSFSNTSGKLSLSYQLTDTILGYATYSTGYRSGGFNGEAFNSVEDTADQFDEETIENFELGIKMNLMDNRLRLNASYYDYSYEDLQVSTLLAKEDGSVTSKTSNAGSADRDGFELEIAALPHENLMLSLNYSKFSGDYSEYPPIFGGGTIIPTTDLAKNPNIPDNQIAFNMDWRMLQTNVGELSLNVNGVWQEETQPISINTAVYNDIYPVVFEQLPNNERTLLNARLVFAGISMGRAVADIALWGRNLLNEDYRQFSFNYGPALGLNVAQFGDPRTYGLELRLKF